jgi:hypothetical protein
MAAKSISRGQKKAINRWVADLRKQNIDPSTASAADFERTIQRLPRELRRRSIDDLRALAQSKLIAQGVGRLEFGGFRADGPGTAIAVRADAARASAGAPTVEGPDPALGESELTVGELLAAADDQKRSLDRALGEARELKRLNDLHKAAIERRRKQAIGELVAALLPALDSSAFERAAALTGFEPLALHFPLSELDAKREEHRARVAEIERDPAYQNPDPTSEKGAADRALETAELLIERAVPEREPQLQALIDIGYDTDHYGRKVRTPTWISHGWAADEILARFPEARGSFATLAKLVTGARNEIETLRARAAALGAKLELETEHQERNGELQGRPGTTLGSAREALTNHLIEADPAVMGPRLKDHPEIVLYTRFDGLGRQLEYLERLGAKKLDEIASHLDQELKLLMGEIEAATLHKDSSRTIPAAQIRRSFTDRATMYADQLAMYRRVQEAISKERDDASCSSASFLEAGSWWTLFTRELGRGDPAEFFDNPAAGIGGALYRPRALGAQTGIEVPDPSVGPHVFAFGWVDPPGADGQAPVVS